MSTPADTPSIATINGQGPSPVEDQHYKRWMLTMVEAFLSGGAGGLMQLVAGEAVIGKTVGVSELLLSTPTLSVAGEYATGDYIGQNTTPNSIANAVRVSGGKGVIKSLVITDKLTTAAVDMELWLFSATFTPPTDNAAWDISDADNLNCIGVIPIDSAKWYASASNKVFTDDTLGLEIELAATTLFYALVARGTTPAWASGDLQLKIGILQD